MKIVPNLPQQAYYNKQENRSFLQATEEFSLMARADGRSPRTIELYSYVFDSFSLFCGGSQLDQIDALIIRHYLVTLQDRGLKPTTVAIHHRVLHAFFTWAKREGLTDSNAISDVPAPRTPKTVPQVLSEAEVTALLAACKRQTKQGLRDYAMLLLMLDCGLRLGEVRALCLGDVNLPTRTLLINGKGAKQRHVFMGSRTAKALRQWLNTRGKCDFHQVFIDRKLEPLKKRWIEQMLSRLAARAGISGVSPHALRRTSATMAVGNGMGPFELRRLYGWENLETALRYYNAANPRLREAHAQASPIDRLLG